MNDPESHLLRPDTLREMSVPVPRQGGEGPCAPDGRTSAFAKRGGLTVLPSNHSLLMKTTTEHDSHIDILLYLSLELCWTVQATRVMLDCSSCR